MSSNSPYQFVLDPKSKMQATDGMFEILKAYFDCDIREVEKYAAANISVMVSQSFDSVCGRDFYKRPSKKQTGRIRDLVLKKIRTRYGKFFDISDFSYRNRRDSFRFNTNLHYSYKHKKGILYGHAPETFLRPLFYTSHSLERFQERVDPELYKGLTEVYRRLRGCDPTPASLLDILIRSTKSWGHDKGCKYLNVVFGSLVIETFKNVLVCKTFLTPDMLRGDVEWRVIDSIDVAGEEYYHMNKLTDLFEHRSAPKDPLFYSDDKEFGEALIRMIALSYGKNNQKFATQ